jgi:hypothetical protein
LIAPGSLPVGALTDVTVALEWTARVPSVSSEECASVEFHQERIHAEHGRRDQCAAVPILNVSGMNDGMNQQALRIDKNMPLLALDLLSRIVTRRINRSPPFQRF